jgi:nicotinate-nucleotide adenylyltransferase
VVKRIGLFGGIFDPVHNGHKTIATAALNQLDLDTLYIIPCAAPPHKTAPVLKADFRTAMCEQVFAGDPRVVVSDIEVKRGGLSYTYQTIEYFKKKIGSDPFFIMGADNIGEIRQWKHPEKIFENATVVVAGRPGFDFLDRFPDNQGMMVPLKIDQVDISSSKIRSYLQQGKDVKQWVPPAALALIRKNKWYRRVAP